MRRRGIYAFLLLNVMVSAAVTFGVLSFFSQEGSESTERVVTFQVIVTATTDPLITPHVTVITATPDPNQPARVVIPGDVLEGTPVASGPVATIDPTLLDEQGRFVGQAEALPENCIQHTLQEGEFPSLIAQQYGVNVFSLLAVNDLDEDRSTNLQIGDVLIVPLEGCPLEAFLSASAADDEDTATGTPEAIDATEVDETEEGETTITATPTITFTPTVTLAPTASNAQVEIVEIVGAGDITTEAVRIVNRGNVVDISGWTLSDAQGNTYIFPDGRRLFTEGSITVNTRAGDNTPILLFWGRDEAVFGDADEVVVLANRDGAVQASLRLPNRGGSP